MADGGAGKRGDPAAKVDTTTNIDCRPGTAVGSGGLICSSFYSHRLRSDPISHDDCSLMFDDIENSPITA